MQGALWRLGLDGYMEVHSPLTRAKDVTEVLGHCIAGKCLQHTHVRWEWVWDTVEIRVVCPCVLVPVKQIALAQSSIGMFGLPWE